MPQHIHYAYRGEHLASFSLFEYAAFIDVVIQREPQKNATSATKPGEPDLGGRTTNATFLFERSHPLYGMRHHYISMQLNTEINPPKDGATKTTEKR